MTGDGTVTATSAAHPSQTVVFTGAGALTAATAAALAVLADLTATGWLDANPNVPHIVLPLGLTGNGDLDAEHEAVGFIGWGVPV